MHRTTGNGYTQCLCSNIFCEDPCNAQLFLVGTQIMRLHSKDQDSQKHLHLLLSCGTKAAGTSYLCGGTTMATHMFPLISIYGHFQCYGQLFSHELEFVNLQMTHIFFFHHRSSLNSVLRGQRNGEQSNTGDAMSANYKGTASQNVKPCYQTTKQYTQTVLLCD